MADGDLTHPLNLWCCLYEAAAAAWSRRADADAADAAASAAADADGLESYWAVVGALTVVHRVYARTDGDLDDLWLQRWFLKEYKLCAALLQRGDAAGAWHYARHCFIVMDELLDRDPDDPWTSERNRDLADLVAALVVDDAACTDAAPLPLPADCGAIGEPAAVHASVERLRRREPVAAV